MSSLPNTTEPSPGNNSAQLAIPEPNKSDLEVGENARAEEMAIAQGKQLDSRKELNEVNRLTRDDKAETHIHIITVIYFYLIAILGIISVLVLFYHHLTPDNWHFLGSEALLKLDGLLLSGGAGIFLDRAGKKIR